MRSVLVASLRTHTRRYVAALLAVTIAVGFVVVTNALASATKNGLSAGVDAAYPGADLVVGDEVGIPEEDVDAALAEAERSGDRAAVVASTWTRVSAGGTSWGDQVSISTVADDPELRRQEIRTGLPPSGPDEALVKASKAEATGVGVGDELTIGTGQQRQEVRVVGLTEGATYLDADVHVPWAALSAMQAFPDAVVYDVIDEGAVDARAETLAGLVSSEVLSRDDYVDQRVTVVNQGVDIVSYLLLLFAGIAGFVAVLVIANTFTILFAQRTRDLALLRCVGATRRQLLRSVRLESLLLALVAATVGIVGGTAAGYGIAAVVRIFADDRVGAVELSPAWLAAAFVGGVVTTLVAAWWPTRAVTRVSPLAALRPVSGDTVRGRAARGRVALGLFVTAAGGALLAVAVAAESMEVLMLGGMTSFTGVLLLGPVLVPALLRLVGSIIGRAGPSSRIAAANAVRNPRRSATTTASLLVGVTLTTAVLTGMASARGAIDADMDASHPVDVALTGTSAVGDQLVRDVEQVDGVSGAVGVPGVMGGLEDAGGVTILAPTTTERSIGRDEEPLTPEEGEVLVPFRLIDSLENGLPEEVTVTADGHTSTLRSRVVSTEWGDAIIVAPDTLAELGGEAGKLAVWVRAEDGADADTLVSDLGAVARNSGLETADALQDRAWVDLQLDVLVWAVLGLLGVGVAIALVGIANTVGLSVLERGREHALLRALGLTRRQLRRVLAAEGLLLAVVAALLGTALGVTYAWLGVATVIQPVTPAVSLELPWLQLAGVLLAAALAGLAACVLPARRAARVMPAEGLTLD
ncbi:ABC transporter permease [Aeromicrobium sp. CTD01-1L150]|uniref:ABC transporter permease n=1 Tax=Aeromicrobium sp. CTD01-1L150 TaxID=3341830 RepID=UPI0035C18819